MAYSKAAPRRVAAAERRRRALRLREAGWSFERIAQSPRDPENGDTRPLFTSRQRAWDAVNQALREIRQNTAEIAEDVLTLELARLDRMQAGLWTRAVQGDDAAVNTTLRILDRRSRYLGLDFTDGLEERAVAVSERQAAQVEEALEAALVGVGMDEQQRLEVFRRVAEHLHAPGDPPAEPGTPTGDEPA